MLTLLEVGGEWLTYKRLLHFRSFPEIALHNHHKTMKKSNLGALSKKLYFPYRLRRQIIEKINIGLITEYQACEKYGLSLKLIRQWRRSYYKYRILSPLNSFPMKAKKSSQDEIKALKAKLAAAQKAYEDEKVKARAYEIMIDIAEEQFQIPIRKKFGPKQPMK